MKKIKDKEDSKVNKKVHRGDEGLDEKIAKLADVTLPAFVESNGSQIFSSESPQVVLGLLINQL